MRSACHLNDGKMALPMVTFDMAKRLKDDDQPVAALTVRVPRTLVSDIDHERKARAVRVPRNTWILEAVVEKLAREMRNPRNGADDGQE